MKTLLLAAALLLAAPAHAQTCALHGTAPSGAKPMLLPGLGHLHHAITATPAAQKWFDQGLRLTYAFNHDEAIRSFQEAARVDPACAMCRWGVALALGPNINLPMSADARAQAAAAVKQAEALVAKGSSTERAYVVALSRRYSGTPSADADYAQAMRALAEANPEDPDAQALFAEALMDLHPWDLWTKDGGLVPDAAEAERALRRALKLDPDHPGAHHFLIHVLEGSAHPEQALPSAQKLPRLMPGAGHVVHMPAHIFLRLGRYAEASAANEAAIKVDEKYLAQTGAQGTYAAMYVAHNFAFLWFSALMEGNKERALTAARALVAHLPLQEIRAMKQQSPAVDFMLAAPLLVMVSFSEWTAILAEPPPPPDLTYLTGLWHFARALARAGTGDHAAAKQEQALFAAFVAAVPATDALGPTNPARDVLAVAQAQLQGDLARRAGDRDAAEAALRRAVALQDALHYDEPPPWPLFARIDLGAVLLEEHDFRGAAAVAREELARHPESPVALLGLSVAAHALGDKDADAIDRRLKKAIPHGALKH